MSRRRFHDMECGIAQALEAFGDWWTLLIIREAFFGVRRFAHFQKSLGISANILSKRLDHLVEHEILTRVDVGTHGEHYEYKLTECGRDLLPVLTAMRDWSDRWVFGEGNEPLIARDRRNGRRLPRMSPHNDDGIPVRPYDIILEPGPGATEETLQRFRQAKEKRNKQAT